MKNLNKFISTIFMVSLFGCSLESNASIGSIKRAAESIHGDKYIFSCKMIRHTLDCKTNAISSIPTRKVDYYGTLPSEDYIERNKLICEKINTLKDACLPGQDVVFPKAGIWSTQKEFDYDVIGGCKHEDTGRAYKISWYYPSSLDFNNVQDLKSQCELDGNEFIEADDQDKDF